MSTALACRRCRVAALAIAALAGALFGAGLLLSGMTQPARVVGFLDVLGAWDPSLAFVMMGAVAVYAVVYQRLRRRSQPWFGGSFHLPTRRDVDLPLITGAAIFGVGWGLAGICPGPGLVSAASGSMPAIEFVAAMVAGMYLRDRMARSIP